MIVLLPLMIATTILTEAALSYLSIGVQSPQASWGTIIEDGQALLYTRPWVAIAPGIMIVLVVLALNANTYAFIKRLDSITAPTTSERFFDPLVAHHYRVALPQIKTSAPLPSQPLGWTSIAYVLWDDLEPTKLSKEQQEAMLDWLHWGGQIIINGPDSLDMLKGSFLDPYLPATNGGTQKYAPDDKDIASLSDGWKVRSETHGKRLEPTTPWSGIKLAMRTGDDISVLPNTGGLFAERRVGRGRVVVSAIRLYEREFINWRSGFEREGRVAG